MWWKSSVLQGATGSVSPNGEAERRGRCCLGLALYFSRVRSSDLLGDIWYFLRIDTVTDDTWEANLSPEHLKRGKLLPAKLNSIVDTPL